MFHSNVDPYIWWCSEDTRAMLERFDRDGFCWVRMEGVADIARHSSRRLVEILFGWRPLAVHVDDGDGGEGHPYLPPGLEIFVCEHPARYQLVDSWHLLSQLDLRRSPLAEALFYTQRIIKFPGFVWCGPTFSQRAGHVVCVHNATPLKNDPVGNELERMIACEDPLRCELEPGDLLIVNNHRMLHAGPRAQTLRILAWFFRPFATPNEYVLRASRVARSTESRAVDQPMWIRKRLGLSKDPYEPADLVAHYRGELREDVAQQAQLIRAHALATGHRSTPPPEPRHMR